MYLIIGKNGQVGFELVEACRENAFDSMAVGREELDLSDLNSIDRFFAEHHDFKAVINAAAYTAVDKAEDEPDMAFLINDKAVAQIARNCEKYNLPLIHLSTDYVFSGNKETLYSEKDEVNPLGVYGRSKLAGEQSIVEVCKNYVILRVSWVFGRHGHNFVKTMSRLLSSKDALSVVSDQYGCPTAARDIADVILQIIPNMAGNSGIYHYGGYPLTTWHQLAQGVLDKLSVPSVSTIAPIGTSAYPTKAKRPKYSGLDVSLLKNTFGISQGYWVDFLQETIDASFSN